MDNLAELVPQPIEAEIAGRVFKLEPLRIADWAHFTNLLNERRDKPLDILKRLADGATAEQQHLLVEMAWTAERRGCSVTEADVRQWFKTHEGAVHKLYRHTRKHHPALGFDECENLVLLNEQEKAAAAEQAEADLVDAVRSDTRQIQETLTAILERLDGDPVGNSPGPAASGA